MELRLKQGTCRGCGARILWALTVNQKQLCLDPEQGNTLLGSDGVARVLTASERAEARLKGLALHVPHWASCEAASKFRKAKGG